MLGGRKEEGGFPPPFHLSHVNWLPLQPGGEGKLLPEAKKSKSRRLDTRYRFFCPERSVTTVLRSRNNNKNFCLSSRSSYDYEGWDNPFRPEGELSHEAEELLRMWREGKLKKESGKDGGGGGGAEDQVESFSFEYAKSHKVTHF